MNSWVDRKIMLHQRVYGEIKKEKNRKKYLGANERRYKLVEKEINERAQEMGAATCRPLI